LRLHVASINLVSFTTQIMALKGRSYLSKTLPGSVKLVPIKICYTTSLVSPYITHQLMAIIH